MKINGIFTHAMSAYEFTSTCFNGLLRTIVDYEYYKIFKDLYVRGVLNNVNGYNYDVDSVCIRGLGEKICLIRA